MQKTLLWIQYQNTFEFEYIITNNIGIKSIIVLCVDWTLK